MDDIQMNNLSEFGISVVDTDGNELTYGDLFGVDKSRVHYEVDTNAENLAAVVADEAMAVEDDNNVEADLVELVDQSEEMVEVKSKNLRKSS